MGANGADGYRFRSKKRELKNHLDTRHKIAGHKLYLSKDDVMQSKNILEADEANCIKLAGRCSADGTITVQYVDVITNNDLSLEIDLKYTNDGRIAPFNGAESGTHCHYWTTNKKGEHCRKKTGRKHEPVPDEYISLLDKIVEFNKKGIKYNGKH